MKGDQQSTIAARLANHPIKAGPTAFLLSAINLCNAEGRYWPEYPVSRATMMARVGCSQHSLNRYIQTLAMNELLAVEESEAGYTFTVPESLFLRKKPARQIGANSQSAPKASSDRANLVFPPLYITPKETRRPIPKPVLKQCLSLLEGGLKVG